MSQRLNINFTPVRTYMYVGKIFIPQEYAFVVKIHYTVRIAILFYAPDRFENAIILQFSASKTAEETSLF